MESIIKDIRLPSTLGPRKKRTPKRKLSEGDKRWNFNTHSSFISTVLINNPMFQIYIGDIKKELGI